MRSELELEKFVCFFKGCPLHMSKEKLPKEPRIVCQKYKNVLILTNQKKTFSQWYETFWVKVVMKYHKKKSIKCLLLCNKTTPKFYYKPNR